MESRGFTSLHLGRAEPFCARCIDDMPLLLIPFFRSPHSTGGSVHDHEAGRAPYRGPSPLALPFTLPSAPTGGALTEVGVRAIRGDQEGTVRFRRGGPPLGDHSTRSRTQPWGLLDQGARESAARLLVRRRRQGGEVHEA